MAFGRSNNAAATDYGAPATTSTGKKYRPMILAANWLHWVSSIIVMSIAAYFIAQFSHNTHIIYWVTIASIDSFLYLPALFLPALKSYKGYLAPVSWAFSYLWLTAFVFASQDYNFGPCEARSPAGVNKCSLKWTLQAFTFLAFFTNIVGQFLETWLWQLQRAKRTPVVAHDDKYAATPAPVAAEGTVPATTV